MADTNDMIRARVDSFVADLTEFIHQSILDNIQHALVPAATAPRSVGRPKVSTNKAAATRAATIAKRVSKKRGGKRTAAELADMAGQLLSFVDSNPGSNIEEIGRGTGIPTKDLALPVKKLLADGKLKKKGQKRATRYSLGRR